jgi:hypothetical protein
MPSDYGGSTTVTWQGFLTLESPSVVNSSWYGSCSVLVANIHHRYIVSITFDGYMRQERKEGRKREEEG